MASKFKFSSYTPLPVHDDPRANSSRSSDPEEREEFMPQSEKEPSSSARPPRRRLFDITSAVVATLLLVATLQFAYHRISHKTQSVSIQDAIRQIGWAEEVRLEPKYSCGHNATEAMSRGCIFDISVLGWLPEQCQDTELHDHFKSYGWKYFLDEEGTQEVDEARLAASARLEEPRERFWVQHGFHVTHCELAWQRMHRALQGGRRLTTHLLNFEHTRHCGEMLEMRDPLYKINSKIMPILNSC